MNLNKCKINSCEFISIETNIEQVQSPINHEIIGIL